MTISEEESALAWQEFLTAYAAGVYGSEITPAIPPIPPDLIRPHNPSAEPRPWAYSDAPLYSSATTISITDARLIRDYYCEHHYLPPPRSPLEGQRHETINAYNLYSPKQLFNIQAATDVIAAFFPGTVCTFSLFHDHIQKHFCLSGNQNLIHHYQLAPGLRIPAEDSLCGHAVLHEDSIFFVKDLKADRRYLNNPFVFAGFKSFIGSSVSLQPDPLSEGPRIVVGTLNVCFIDEPLGALTMSQRKVLRHVTAMLETQLRATWEGDQRTKEGRARLALTELIQDALVDVKLDEGDGIATDALERMCQVLPDVDMVVLLNTGGVDMAGKFIPGIGTPCEVVASAGSPYLPISRQQLLDCVNSHPTQTVFQAGVNPKSGLESYLNPSVRSHLILPLHSTSRPNYLILATSSTYYTFPNADVNIIRSMASVLRARAVQCGVMLADAAKTSFLSSISHELRTPMHGVKASLELIRKSVDGQDWDEVEGPLGLAEASGRALLNILNDVLDFGKNDWAKADEKEIDLSLSAREIAGVCLAHHGELGSVSVRFEYEDRKWGVIFSEAKFHRIIMNGLTNAIKFTPNGEITISLTTSPHHNACIVQIRDNGIGIDSDALPRLMQPFTKMDSDSPGAGLGLYITKALVEKMGGELTLTSTRGQGTIFTATLPIRLLSGRDTQAPIRSLYLRQPKTSSPPPRRSSVTTNPSPLTSPSIGIALPPLRILIIDDNEICRKILRMAFKRAPLAITSMEAENGQIGVDLFEEFAPDVVFTDVSMPVMDGVTAAGKMREILAKRPRPCRIYAVTGLGSSDPRTQSIGVHRKAALDGWLVKGKDMLDAIYKILQGAEEGRS